MSASCYYRSWDEFAIEKVVRPYLRTVKQPAKPGDIQRVTFTEKIYRFL